MPDVFVGDNDHGDVVPPTDVLLEMIKTLRENVVHLAYELNEIKEGFEGCCNACEPVGLMNKKLREERDEARRSCCEFAAMVDSADTVLMYVDSNRFQEIAIRYMKSRGWDCFTEDSQ